MKKIMKMLVLALALTVSFSLGAGSTAEAAKKTKVTVKKVTSVDKVTGSKTITLAKGKKATLKTTVTVTPNKAANKKVTYKSSNKKVATVNSKGTITAKKAGSAKITVTSKKNSKKKATVKVKVVAGKVTSVDILGADKKSVKNKTIDLKMGATESVTLSSKVKTSGKKPNKTLKWTSSKTDVATVSSKGVVTAKKAGTTIITVKSTDGTNKSAKVTVKVAEADKKYQTTVAPKNGATVEVEVTFADKKTLQDDLNAFAKFSKDSEVVVNLDGQNYTAKVENGVVKINGKTIAQSAKAQNAKSVKVKATIKADKIAAVTAFAPASVASVKVGNVTFTEVKTATFKIGATTYTYTVKDGKIIVEGNVETALAGLKTVADVTAAEVK